jgi:DNA-binding MarR family transcriptional regulator
LRGIAARAIMRRHLDFRSEFHMRARQKGNPGEVKFALEDSPFYWINRTSSRYVVEMERGLKTMQMDMPRWRVLMILHEQEPRSISEIADIAAIRLSTMTRVVQRLAATGHVALSQRASDGRKTDVRITRAGQAALAKVRQVVGRVYLEATEGLSDAEILMLNGLMRRLFEGLGRGPRPSTPVARRARS